MLTWCRSSVKCKTKMCNSLFQNFCFILTFQQILILSVSPQTYNNVGNNPDVGIGTVSSRLNSTTASNKPDNATIIRLQEYPDYSTRLDLGNIPGCSSELGTNCSIVLIPPDKHGVFIIVQYPIKSKLTLLEAVFRFSFEELQALRGTQARSICQDYLRIKYNHGTGSAIRTCSASLIENSQLFIVNYFVGAKHHSNPNGNVYLTLIQSIRAPDTRGIHLMPSIVVTSYIDCAKLGILERQFYTECNTNAIHNGDSPKRCIRTKLFCDENPNCMVRDTGQVILGTDETDCDINLNTSTFRSTEVPWWQTTSTYTFGTTGRPWWTTSTTTVRSDSTVEDKTNRPSSGSVIIYVVIMVIMFCICSFLGKIQSTSDFTNYGGETNYGTESNSRPVDYGSYNFDIPDDEDDDPPPPLPPPAYIDDTTLPSYNSLFIDCNEVIVEVPQITPVAVPKEAEV